MAPTFSGSEMAHVKVAENWFWHRSNLSFWSIWHEAGNFTQSQRSIRLDFYILKTNKIVFSNFGCTGIRDELEPSLGVETIPADCALRPEGAHGLEPEMASGPERLCIRRRGSGSGPSLLPSSLYPLGNIISIFIFAPATCTHFARQCRHKVPQT